MRSATLYKPIWLFRLACRHRLGFTVFGALASTEEALQRVRTEAYTIPLHRQFIPWAVRKGVTLHHRADNSPEMIWVRVD